QLPVRDLTNVLFPTGAGDRTLGDAHLGLLAGFLALVALCRWRRNPLVLILFLVGLYALLSSTGEHLGLAYVNYRIPRINKIRHPSRRLILFTLACGALSAIGLSTLLDWAASRSVRLHAGYGAAAAAFAALAALCYAWRPDRPPAVPDTVLFASLAAVL